MHRLRSSQHHNPKYYERNARFYTYTLWNLKCYARNTNTPFIATPQFQLLDKRYKGFIRTTFEIPNVMQEIQTFRQSQHHNSKYYARNTRVLYVHHLNFHMLCNNTNISLTVTSQFQFLCNKYTGFTCTPFEIPNNMI